MSRRWRVLWLLALAELLAMTLWFSATAVVPQLAGELALDDGAEAWLTMSVQVGFVAGAHGAAAPTAGGGAHGLGPPLNHPG